MERRTIRTTIHNVSKMALIVDIAQIAECLAIIASIFFFTLGSYFDLKMREVEDWVWLVYGSIGAPLTIIRLYLDPSLLVLTIISIAITILISFGLFYFGLFGGADAESDHVLGCDSSFGAEKLSAAHGLLASILPYCRGSHGVRLLSLDCYLLRSQKFSNLRQDRTANV